MVYLIRSNTLRNDARKDYNRKIEHEYKQQFGSDWRKGAEKAGYVSHEEGRQIARNAKKQQAQKEKGGFAGSVKESLEVMASRRQISGKQAQRLANIADQM